MGLKYGGIKITELQRGILLKNPKSNPGFIGTKILNLLHGYFTIQGIF